jgi:hypothetical protein
VETYFVAADKPMTAYGTSRPISLVLQLSQGTGTSTSRSRVVALSYAWVAIQVRQRLNAALPHRIHRPRLALPNLLKSGESG